MKDLKLYLIGLLLLSLTSGCIIDFDDDGLQACIRGQGGIVSEELNIAPFTGFDLEIAADVFVTQGEEFSVVAEGQANIIRELDLAVRNDFWMIDLDRCVRNRTDLRIYITMPVIERIEVSGSGSVYGENLFETDDLFLEIDGSGDIDLAVESDDIDGVIDGSGNIRMEGTADNLYLRIEGSGLFRAFALETQTANIRIDGSGDAEVWVNQELNVRITGSGDVLYKGQPVIDTSIDGSGRVVDAN